MLLQTAFGWYAVLAQAKTNSSIFGVVTDEDGNPIPFATIQVSNTHTGTVADMQGKYTLEVDYTDKLELQFSSIGFISRTLEVTIVTGKKQEINMQLATDRIAVNEVQVNGIHKTTQVEQSGYAANSVSLKEIQSEAIDLNLVLRQIPGVQVRQQAGFGSRVSYSINGMDGSAIRFFYDEIPMEYFGSSFSPSTIPVNQLERVDVYKGVVPVDLGSDALGGAISLHSRKDLQNTLFASYTMGSFNTHNASVSGTWRDSASGFTGKVDLFYNYSDNDYEVWGDDIYVTNTETFEVERGIRVPRFHDAFESASSKTEVGFTRTKWAEKAMVGFLYSGMDKEMQHGATMEVPFGKASYTQQVLMPYLNLQSTPLLHQKLELRNFTFYSSLERSRVDTTRNIYNWYGEVEPIKRVLGGEQSYTLNQLTENSVLNRFNTTFKFNHLHKLVYNYVFTHVNRTDRDPLITQKTEGYYAPQILNKHVMGLSYNSLWLQEKLLASLFVKYFGYNASVKVSETVAGVTEYSTHHASAAAPGYGVALAYTASNRVKLNFSFENSTRLPEANEILGDGLVILPNKDLQAEKSFNANAGFDVYPVSNAHHHLRMTGNLFYRNVSQKMMLAIASDPGVFQYINFDNVLINGVDGSVDYAYKNWFSFVQSAAYTHPIIQTDTDEFGNSNGLDNTRMPNTPFFNANTEARIHLNELLDSKHRSFVYWRFNYVAPFYRHSEKYGNKNKDYIPQQQGHNLGAGYGFLQNKLIFSVDVSNIFNAQLYDNYALQKPGRAFYLKINYQFYKSN